MTRKRVLFCRRKGRNPSKDVHWKPEPWPKSPPREQSGLRNRGALPSTPWKLAHSRAACFKYFPWSHPWRVRREESVVMTLVCKSSLAGRELQTSQGVESLTHQPPGMCRRSGGGGLQWPLPDRPPPPLPVATASAGSQMFLIGKETCWVPTECHPVCAEGLVW